MNPTIVHQASQNQSPYVQSGDIDLHVFPFLHAYCDFCHAYVVEIPGEEPHSRRCLARMAILVLIPRRIMSIPVENKFVFLANFPPFPQNVVWPSRHFINISMGIDLRKFEMIPAPEFLICGRCFRLFPRSRIGSHLLFCSDFEVPHFDLFEEISKKTPISSLFNPPSTYVLADERFTMVLLPPQFVRFS